MADIKAIETEYAGCRFRSRLEARWAVFFDRLGIPWHYEEEGYELPSGRYLPDFRIEQVAGSGICDILVEVKGSIDDDGARRLLQIAAELDPNNWPVFIPKLLVLGNIVRPNKRAIEHVLLNSLGSGWIMIQPVVFMPTADRPPILWSSSEPTPIRVADIHDRRLTSFATWEIVKSIREDAWLGSLPTDGIPWRSTTDGAYQAARSARFEFGESGARRP